MAKDEAGNQAYKLWFSYHLNHTAKDKMTVPWIHCEECGKALDNSRFECHCGTFGLKSRHTLKCLEVSIIVIPMSC